MATAGISGMAKAAIDTAQTKVQSNPTMAILLVIVIAYFVYAWMVGRWPFKK